MPPNPYWNCALAITVIMTSMLASTLFILAMTFERCYSILWPHRVAAFNTLGKAKIAIVLIIIFSILFSIPNLYFSDYKGKRCIFNKSSIPNVQIYAWFSYTLHFALPFVLLSVMNFIIIIKLQQRSNFTKKSKSHSKGQTGSHTIHNSEKQIYTMLLLVTFAYLVLVTPGQIYAALYSNVIAPKIKTARVYVGIYLFYHIGHKLAPTNNAINFFLYVISGHKFRDDLLSLLLFWKRKKNDTSPSHLSLSQETSRGMIT